MNRQAALLGVKRPVLSPESDLWRHAAVRPLADHEGLLTEPQEPRADGHDLSRVPVHASGPDGGQAEVSCPLTPQRCPFGGACHTCPTQPQAKLAVNEPEDEYEQAADRVADQLTRAPEAQLQRQATNQTGSATAPPIVHDVLRSPGQPLDPAMRTFMEPRFGHDFSRVLVHADAKAAESARAVDALAYTVGRDVVFAAGQYAPSTSAGQSLLAHELTHVIQQGAVAHVSPPGALAIDGSGSALEQAATVSTLEPSPYAASAVLACPRLQRQPAPAGLPGEICYQPGMVPTALRAGDCNAKEPENCSTYEGWLNTFRRLRTFTARDTAPGQEDPLRGFSVIGARATRTVDVKEGGEVPSGAEPPQPVGHRAGDEFIDHPTDNWVKNCLPENLRQTAYQLPSNCADMAVILRHVWLSAHHRTESYAGWQIGDRAGGPRQRHVGAVIADVSTLNVARMLNPYTGPDGKPLQSFAALQGLLHPGDVLVWAHHAGGLGTRRTGGHTQTITHIDRRYPGGGVTQIGVVQGNQPISPPSAAERAAGDIGQTGEIQRYIREERGGRVPSVTELRYSPGRRIEASRLVGGSLRDLPLPARTGRRASAPPPKVWTLSDGHTTLVAAGPPASARRPSMRRIAGEKIRRISDWFSSLRNATRERLHGVFEGALLETRSMIEGGQTGLENDAQELGRTAGERLWNLARQAGQSQAGDLAEETHFRPLRQMRAMIQAIGNPTGDRDNPRPGYWSSASPRAAAVRTLFQSIDASFHYAARGATTLSFRHRARRGISWVNVLVTGFDPFVDRSGTVPPPGVVNPSGAAALAMDNTTVEEGTVAASVQGVVLPVSFDDFRAGMVENIVRPLVRSNGVDAVLTTSLDRKIPQEGPVEIERYVVGVHLECRKPVEQGKPERCTLGRIPAAPGGELGPAIIETAAPVEQIAAETERLARRRRPGIQRPTIGTNVMFRFPSTTLANQALKALKLKPTTNREVEIADPIALHKIISTMTRHPNGTDITFRAGGREYSATVVAGPGGDFLSNEVSYRVLRLLGEERRLDIPSFHVHVPEVEEPIPQGTSTRAERRACREAIRSAIGVRDRIVSTLKRMILAVARRIVAARNPPAAP